MKIRFEKHKIYWRPNLSDSDYHYIWTDQYNRWLSIHLGRITRKIAGERGNVWEGRYTAYARDFSTYPGQIPKEHIDWLYADIPPKSWFCRNG